MTTYNYDLSGVASGLQHGVGGGVMVWNTNHFESTSDGSTLANFRIPLTPINANDAASKNYVDNLPQPYDMFIYRPDQAPAGATIVLYTFTRGVVFPNNFSGASGSVEANPTAVYACDIQRNGTSIGTLSVSTTGAVTFTTAGATTESFVAGDKLQIIAPAGVDATLAGLSFTLVGTR